MSHIVRFRRRNADSNTVSVRLTQEKGGGQVLGYRRGLPSRLDIADINCLP